MTLLLTSAGMRMKSEIVKILPKELEQTRLAYINTAFIHEAPDNADINEDRRALAEAGFQIQDIDIQGKNEAELRGLLKEFDVIFVEGGNTFYLLKAVRESGFDTVVKELLKEGIIYIGVSAGSIIAGPTIETASWYYAALGGPDENKVGIRALVALNLIPFNIFVHYIPEDEREVRVQSGKSPYPTRIPTNYQAFLVQDENVTLVGEGREVEL